MATPRYYFFDSGVRGDAAGMTLDRGILATEGGRLFEHFVLLEIIRRIRGAGLSWRVHYWRTAHGAEVDIVIDKGDELVPIEVKYSDRIRPADLSGLRRFLDDYPRAKRGWVIFKGPRPRRIDDRVTALPWNML